MHYPYNAILGRGSTNAFKAIISHPYLCMRMPAINGVITVFRDQSEARNVEKDSSPGHRNIHVLAISNEDDKKKQKRRSLNQRHNHAKKQKGTTRATSA